MSILTKLNAKYLRKRIHFLTRFRIGHCRLTYSFIFDGSGAPVWAECDCLLSVEHILVHCPNFIDKRIRYHIDGKWLAKILGDNIKMLWDF